MKHRGRASLSLVAALAVIGAGLVWISGREAPGVTVLVGERGATAQSINLALGGLGHVLSRDDSGFFNVELSDRVSLAEAEAVLQAHKIEYVLPVSAKVAENNSLPSVRDHIKFLEARHEILTQRSAVVGGVEEESGVDFYEALAYYLQARVGPDGKLDEAEIQRAVQQRSVLPPAPSGLGNGPGGNWVNLGPKGLDIPYSTYYGTPPLSGRKQGVAVAPSNSNIIYTASAGGGIWVSKDNGVSWTPTSDQWAFQQVNCVAVDPTNANIVYAGGGDYDGFFTKQTQGIMKSTNGGASWVQLGAPGMKRSVVTRILINPVPNNLLAATGKGSNPADNGIYRSTDSGATWTQIESGVSVDDLIQTYDHWVYYVGSGGTGTIKTSPDFGATFSPVGSNPCVNTQNALAIAPSPITSGVLYLLSTGDEKIYKSVNYGSTWSNVKGNFPNGFSGNANYNWSQKTYDYDIACTSNGGVDVVLVGLITVAQSTGGTGTWIDLTKSYDQAGPNFVHNDQHCLAIDPNNASRVFIGCDGGLFRYTYSATPVQANFASLNQNLKDIQFYDISLHPTDLNRIMGGSQDNASPASYGNLSSWKNLLAGDGAWSTFDQNNPAIHYTGSQFGSVFRYTTDNDTTGDDITPSSQSPLFIAPLMCAGNGSDLFIGETIIQKWSSGHTWNAVSPTLGGKAICLATSPTDLTAMYTGTDTGKIWRSVNSGVNWNEATNPASSRPVGAIAVQSANKNDILAGYQGTGTSHLWRTTDASAATPVWTDVSGVAPFRLPDTVINAVAIDPYEATRWYVGTDAGVFMTMDSGASWYNMNTLGLPNVQINALRVNKLKNALYAGTFGRGLYRLAIGPYAAPYSIKGTVYQLGGTTPLQNATLTLQKYQQQQTPFVLNSNTAIPDNNTTGISKPVVVGITQIVTGVTVSLNISHTWIGDIQVDLFAPDGRSYRVWNRAGGSANNIVADFDLGTTFNGMNTKGTWTLVVKDLASGDTGTLNQWKLNFKYNTYVTVGTQTTPANGTYTFPTLAGGSYRWSAAFTGKGFAPALRGGLLGPNMTGQNFTATN